LDTGFHLTSSTFTSATPANIFFTTEPDS